MIKITSLTFNDKNKLENIIKLRIGYYNSMLDVLLEDDPDKNQRNIFILETKKRALEQVLEDYHSEKVYYYGN